MWKGKIGRNFHKNVPLHYIDTADVKLEMAGNLFCLWTASSIAIGSSINICQDFFFEEGNKNWNVCYTNCENVAGFKLFTGESQKTSR